MTKQTDTLKAKLAQSMKRTPRTIGKTAAQPSRVPLVASPAGRIAVPVTVTLAPDDIARLDAIRDALRDAGYRISASEAVKIALRTVKPSPALAQVYLAVRADDGRRKH